jgi:CelD/BcsL family acetyltransferase involved in cellulose biosynthesis
MHDTRVLRTFTELESLRDEWASLSAPFGSPLLDHDWFACAARAFHRESDLRVVTVRQNGVLAAVAPMAIDASGHLVFLGSTKLNEPSGLLYASETELRRLTGRLLKIGEAIVLDRLTADAPLAGLLPELTRWHAISITRETAKSYSVPTNIAWPPYLASLSSSFRRKLNGARTRAEREVGPVRFVRQAPTPEELDAALAPLVALEAAGWKGQQGSALGVRPELLDFFKSYGRRAAASGRVRVSVLWFGDIAAASEFAIEAYGRMWQLKVTYDERFAECVPGLQLIHQSIAAANAAGLSAYEFLGSAEAWQERWRPEPRSYQMSAIYPFSTSGMATAVRDAASRLSRRGQPVARPAAAAQ